MRTRSVIALLLMVLALSPPAATASASVDASAAPAIGASELHVDVTELPGFAWIEVHSSTTQSKLNGTSGEPRTCVSARWSVLRRGGDVREVRAAYGCGHGVTRHELDRLSGNATVAGSVPIRVRTTVWEQTPAGWYVVDERREAVTATLDLTWRGTGEERVSPWLHAPGLCYAFPPLVCHLGVGVGAGVGATRSAVVDGSVELGDGTVAELDARPGRMRWSVSTPVPAS